MEKKPVVEYARNVVEKGVACCDHTCNNPLQNQMFISSGVQWMAGLIVPAIICLAAWGMHRAGKHY